MSSRKKVPRAATSNKRGKQNVSCLEAPLETLTGTDKEMEKKTVPHADDIVRVQRMWAVVMPITHL